MPSGIPYFSSPRCALSPRSRKGKVPFTKDFMTDLTPSITSAAEGAVKDAKRRYGDRIKYIEDDLLAEAYMAVVVAQERVDDGLVEKPESYLFVAAKNAIKAYIDKEFKHARHVRMTGRVPHDAELPSAPHAGPRLPPSESEKQQAAVAKRQSHKATALTELHDPDQPRLSDRGPSGNDPDLQAAALRLTIEMACIDDADREIVRLRKKGLTLEDTGTIVGMTRGSVSKRLARLAKRAGISLEKRKSRSSRKLTATRWDSLIIDNDLEVITT